ncbi:MAG: NmrA family NAD(P)-binding protein [Bacteroidetes bacterium]|nr:NmrA family NAD(P)-binding protein [Bacteroidota bacterium]
MKRILVSGATGNIGCEVVHYLSEQALQAKIYVAARNIEAAKKRFSAYPNLEYRQFDFANSDTFTEAFKNIDLVFLLRPPQISNVEAVFLPLLKSAQESGISEIVFLSVQGAEKSTVIPHNKIETLIQKLGFKYIFVRPSYFMQNLSTSLRSEIVNHQRITLPSGRAKFNWIDVKNIGEATAVLISQFDQHQNKAFEITGKENMNFEALSALMTEILGLKIKYKSINPLRFYFKKKGEGLKSDYALVLTILHFLPRLQAEPRISEN